MVLYFSGTGNSRLAAQYLAKSLGEETPCPMLDIERVNYERLILVMPVYSWGIPPVVADWIRNVKIAKRPKQVWALLTCGDETGNAHHMLSSKLSLRGWPLSGVFSVIMPNTYVLLPGFDVDSKIVEHHKLTEAPQRIAQIAQLISSGKPITDVEIGSFPGLKTNLVYPLFKRWGINVSKWRVDTAKCTHCGRCVKDCPVKNISLSADKSPVWGSNCASCLACFHKCPSKAIGYGKITSKKGHYIPPKSL